MTPLRITPEQYAKLNRPETDLPETDRPKPPKRRKNFELQDERHNPYSTAGATITTARPCPECGKIIQGVGETLTGAHEDWKRKMARHEENHA